MTSRYDICKQALLTNIGYAKINNINIIICLFDDTVRLHTNIKINEDTKNIINEQFQNRCIIYDSQSYDQIISEINESMPMGSTNFMIPFEILSCINEISKTSEIFFLSDGYNSGRLTDDNITFLDDYKNRVTTLGIGSKMAYDEKTLSLLSKTNETIGGDSADIIQQELLAQMSDVSSQNTTDMWKDVEITIMGEISKLKFGSMMQITAITDEEYNSTKFVQNTDNQNLIISKSKNNYIISKKHVEAEKSPQIKADTLIFIVDQSGSMASDVSSAPEYSIYHIPEEESNVTDDFPDTKYVKYTLKLPHMKSYQRIVFSSEDNKFKGQISWINNDNIKQTMTLHNYNKYTNITDPVIQDSLEISNEIGHYINIAKISNKSDKIGYFRTINQIIKKNKKMFNEIEEKNLLTDFSLLEILFYNKKQGMILFESTLSPSEKNMNHLLNTASSGGGYKMFAATATMSAVCARSPSQGGGDPHDAHDHNINKSRDISICTICYDEIREYIFSCGHCYACNSCAEKVLNSTPKNNCSYCKKEVTWIRKITMTEDQKNNEHYYKCISENCYNIASIVTKCDEEYHLTYCSKCYSNGKKEFKKSRKTKMCFCGKEITKIMDKIYFN